MAEDSGTAVEFAHEQIVETSFPAIPQRVRLLEFCLVMAVAILPLLIGTVFSLFHPAALTADFINYKLSRMLVDEAASIALLAYVLFRQGRSFRDLGLGLRTKDLLHSIGLLLGGYFIFYWAYIICHLSGFSPNPGAVQRTAAWVAGIRASALGTILVCLNPIFEELIVRAYLLTEVEALTGSVAVAVVLSSLVQATYHLYQGGPIALSMGAMFLLFSIYYAKTRRLVPLVLAHFLMDLLGIFQ